MQQIHSYQDYPREELLVQVLHWANAQSHFSFHQNNGIEYPHGGFKEILAVGAKRLFEPREDTFEVLKSFHKNQWLFGFIGYNLKNEIEKLRSENSDHLQFSNAILFEPKHIIHFEENGFIIESEQANLLQEILSFPAIHASSSFADPIASVSQASYFEIIESLRQHIEEGDCYEINFCQEFHGKVNKWNAVETFFKLNRISPKPFSCFQKFKDHYILCASPERFLKKVNQQIISQPIKGTRPRFSDPELDEQQKTELRHSEKEMAENMMIVDLVRNDLARTAKTGSVKVEEMFGIYSFQQVHQMISTVVSEMREDVHFVDVIKHAFPMGSMTGAPKVKVMQLIEQYENTNRGAFSGASGYIEPNGDFDFNVLIRSLFVNQFTNTYSYQVGGAITYDSIPEQEYEECMIKAKAILEVLKNH